MAEPNAASETRILTLRRRWEADRASSAFLPLAEEFRRLGRFSEAIEALETGLRLQPSYLSAQVALGRCRLESGDAAGAGAVLEKVVATDPTQLVANKLLVEAYLQSGEPRRALERLNAYSALNDRDPDLPGLKQRILTRLTGASTAPQPPSEADSPLHLAAAAAPADDLFALPSVAAPPDLSELWPAALPELPEHVVHAGAGPGAPRKGRSVNGAAGDGVLFPGLHGPAVTQRYLSALFAEGLFAVAAPALAASPERGHSASFGVAAQPQPAVDLRVQAKPAWEPPAPEAGPESGRGWSEGVAWPAAATDLVEAPPEPSSPAEATVTLGTLYLGQGHLSEAAEIFNAVLDREPENVAARQGLELAGLSDEFPLASMAPPEGVTARKVRVLRGYLGSLRQGAPGDVP